MSKQHERGYADIDDLVAAPYNPREIDEAEFKGLKSALKEFGIVQEVVVNRRTGYIVSGHQRIKALKESGVTQVPVCWVDLDDAREKALNLALNNQRITGRFTDGITSLIEEISIEVPDLVIDLRLDDINVEVPEPEVIEPEGGDTDGDVSEPAEEPDSELGRVYQLGPHRVMCGDSSNREDVEVLMRGDKAALLLTDPPYNIVEEGENFAANADTPKMYGKLEKEDWDVGFEFRSVAPNIDFAVAEDASAYVFTSHTLFGEVLAELAETFRYTNFAVWAKPAPTPSLAKRHWTWSCELVVYATRGKHAFNFPPAGHALSVWTIPNNASNSLHPTQKPVPVMAHPMLHSSKPKDIVLDLFLGSGSTLMAAAEHGRVCYGMERDPKYVDVIRKRYAAWCKSVKKDPGPDALA